jgi:hypothetical protein
VGIIKKKFIFESRGSPGEVLGESLRDCKCPKNIGVKPSVFENQGDI